jgi:hypothetical protein
MTHIFDVFRLEASGPSWLESAVTFERAKARIQELAVPSPGEYVVLDQGTGNKHAFRFAWRGRAQSRNGSR